MTTPQADTHQIGIQMHTLRSIKDPDARYAAAREAGYHYVECPLLESASDTRTLLNKHQLKLMSIGLMKKELEEHWDDIFELLTHYNAIGAMYAWHNAESKESWIEFAQWLNGYAIRFKERGFALMYHNHGHEFSQQYDGQTPIELILEHAPDLYWQFDIGWAVHAGADPIKLIETHGHRIKTIHVKDAVNQTTEEAPDVIQTDLGAGNTSIIECLQAAQAAGITHFISEADKVPDPVAFAQQAYQFLKQHLK